MIIHLIIYVNAPSVYSNPFAVSDSKDRLKRVCGFSQYNERKTDVSTTPLPATDPSVLSERVEIQDPAVILVRSNQCFFLAVFQVTGLQVGTNAVQSIPASHIHEPNTHVSGQIMWLSLIDDSHQPSSPDWEWDSGFEPHSSFFNTDGKCLELINPDIQQAL